MNKASFFRRTWNFLKEDTWQSWSISLILALIFIKFLLFPGLSLVTGTTLPVVIVESCSMYHGTGFDDWWFRNAAWYEPQGINKENFELFSMKNGLNKGDIVFVWGYSPYKLGNVIIFEPNEESTNPYPIIHRLISTKPYATKGDNNALQLVINNNPSRVDESNIPKDNIIGKAVFKIPLLGWVKLIFFEPFRPASNRGMC